MGRLKLPAGRTVSRFGVQGMNATLADRQRPNRSLALRHRGHSDAERLREFHAAAIGDRLDAMTTKS
jgi:hypothetical protein